MRCLCRLLVFGLVSLVTACTMPVRMGYDRSIGDYGPPPETGTGKSLASMPESEMSDDLASWMKVVKPWLGTPYQYGGSSRSGTDCSGYVMQVYKQKTGKSLPHSASSQFKMGKSVSYSDLRTGDLVFFGSLWGVTHVGIYLSNGKFTHASSSQGVAIIPLSTPYWKERYRGARRIL